MVIKFLAYLPDVGTTYVYFNHTHIYWNHIDCMSTNGTEHMNTPRAIDYHGSLGTCMQSCEHSCGTYSLQKKMHDSYWIQ